MRRLSVVTVVTLGLALATSASAQSLYERCEQQKAEVAGMKQQVGAIEGQLATIDQQLADLAQRQRELSSQKSLKIREKAGLLDRIHQSERRHGRECSGLAQCAKLDDRVDDLKRSMGPLHQRLRALREELRNPSAESANLNRDVDRVEAEYNRLNCDNLVPGSTPQPTIDRCSALFSEWNAMQARINQSQQANASLRSRYQQIMNELKAREAELSRLLARMRQNCSHSRRFADLERLERENHEYHAISGDLDQRDNNIRRFQKIKIMRPKMNRPGDKPTLRPKRDDDDDQGKRKKKHTLKPVQ